MHPPSRRAERTQFWVGPGAAWRSGLVLPHGLSLGAPSRGGRPTVSQTGLRLRLPARSASECMGFGPRQRTRWRFGLVRPASIRGAKHGRADGGWGEEPIGRSSFPGGRPEAAKTAVAMRGVRADCQFGDGGR